MTYLKEKNKNSVLIGCFWVFFCTITATLGTDVVISLVSAAQVPEKGAIIDLGFTQVGQEAFSEFVGGGLGVLMFGFVAHLLVNVIDGKDKLKLVNWPLENVTENLEKFVKKKAYSDGAELSTSFPDAFSSELAPSDRASAWYNQIYVPVRDTPSVLGSNKEFLYWREIHVFSVLLLVFYSVSFIAQEILNWSLLNWPGLLASLVCTVLLKLAARNAANTLVRNSLAESLRTL